MAPGLLTLGSREIPKDSVHGQSRDQSPQHSHRDTPKGLAQAWGPASGSENQAGGTSGHRRQRRDLPEDLEGLWEATWRGNSVKSTDMNPSCWHKGATECSLVGGAVTSHPGLGEDGRRERSEMD